MRPLSFWERNRVRGKGGNYLPADANLRALIAFKLSSITLVNRLP